MKRERCERTWQAEAREDGRLEPRDLASFERHVPHCEDCTAEIAALRGLTRKMASLPEPERTDLEHRRARNELLQRANEAFLAPKKRVQPLQKFALVAAMALGFSGILWQVRRDAPPLPTFDVVDVTNAVWHTETNASTSRVKLQSGTAAFRVDHLEGASRFLVEMPDGKIEVRGTRFVVDVENGQTRSVEVTEGIVWLEVPRFQGLLHAGERWPRVDANAKAPATGAETNTTLPVPSEKPAATSAIEEDAGAPPTPARNTKGESETHGAPVASAEVARAAPPAANAAPPSKDEAGPRFAEAMQAFTAGNDARADELFAAFVRDFPRDGRAEDAMFLRAKARARRGDMAGASAIAREYLNAFPRGLRRPEAERLVGEAK